MRAIDVASFTLPPPAPCVAPRGCRLGLALAAGAEATGAAAGVTDAASGEAAAAGAALATVELNMSAEKSSGIVIVSLGGGSAGAASTQATGLRRAGPSEP